MAEQNVLTEKSVHRRIKQHIIGQEQQFFAVCTLGLEELLAEEIKSLERFGVDINNIGKVHGGVQFSGSLELMYYSNYTLRIANRILMRISSFTVKSYPELFNKCKRVPWERYIGLHEKIYIKVTAKKSRLHHSDNAGDTVFDGISSYMAGLGSSITLDEDASCRIFVRIFDDTCEISMDTSGEVMYKRGVKKHSVEAPIRESSAAALLRLCALKEKEIVYDPMCGSGTFLIETLMNVKSIYSLDYRSFILSKLPFYKETKDSFVRKKIYSEKNNHTLQIYGTDINNRAVEATEYNLNELRFPVEYTIKNCSYDTIKVDGEKGLLIVNLPYGKRISHGNKLVKEYKAFSSYIKKHYSGWEFALVYPKNKIFDKVLGLSPKTKIYFRNGGLEVNCIFGKLP